MSRRFVLQVVLLGIAFALATAVLGWVTVPVLALLWGVVARESERPAAAASLAAALGWALLLVWIAAHGPVAAVARRTAGAMGMPPLAFYALSILFPLVVAWAAATLGQVARSLATAARRT